MSVVCLVLFLVLFFFDDTATTEIYPLSLHDALPILVPMPPRVCPLVRARVLSARPLTSMVAPPSQIRELCEIDPLLRSEEHTSELQSQFHLVCRLLLEKKKNKPQEYHCRHYQPAQRN